MSVPLVQLAQYVCSEVFQGLFVRYNCRNWRLDKSGTNRRVLTSANTMQRIAHAINHLAGQCPRINSMGGWTPLTWEDGSGTCAPLLYSAYDDTVQNGTERVLRYLYVPRVAGSNDAKLASYDQDGNEYGVSGPYNPTVASVTQWNDLHYGEISLTARPESGASPGSPTVSDTEVVDGLKTYNGFTVVDYCIQDKEQTYLKVGTHLGCDPSKFIAALPIADGGTEEARASFDELRTRCLGKVVEWSALTVAGAWQTPATPGDQTGLCIDAATDGTDYVNVFDHAVTTRTATSIGISCPARYCGVGNPGKEAGTKVPVKCRVIASVANAGDVGYVKFIGPAHVANNYCEIEVTNTTPALLGDDSDVIYLNSAIADDDATTSRNKIDVHAKVSATDELYIYHLTAWLFIAR